MNVEAAMIFIILFFLIFMGVPIGISIGVSSLVCFILFTNTPLTILPAVCFSGVDSFPLLAVPFFILAGNLMSHGGVAKRIMGFANTLLGFITGGLAVATTMACMIFASISGSAVATASAMGSFVIPEMEKHNYDRRFSASLVASAGTMGIILPPSIPLVIYGVVARESIGALFLAGIIPGILIGIVLMIVSYFMSKKRGWKGTGERPTIPSVVRSFFKSIWAIFAPVIILGGIYAGVFTPTEAAVVAVVYCLLIGLFVYRELNLKNIYKALVDTMIINGQVMYMIGVSIVFANYLSIQRVPTAIAGTLLGISDNAIVLLLIINVFLLLLGLVVDIIPAIIVLTPVLLPVVMDLGMSPVTFGVLIVINLAIGFVTPPYGCNLFVTAAVAKISMESMLPYVVWMILAMLVVLMIVTYIPAATLLFV